MFSNKKKVSLSEGLLRNPIFSDIQFKYSFLRKLSDELKTKQEEPVLSKLDSHLNDILDGSDNWLEKLPQNVQDYLLNDRICKRNKYNGKSIASLLRAIRNTAHHIKEFPADIKETMGFEDEHCINFWVQSFPSLLPMLHIFTQTVKGISTCSLKGKKLKELLEPKYLLAQHIMNSLITTLVEDIETEKFIERYYIKNLEAETSEISCVYILSTTKLEDSSSINNILIQRFANVAKVSWNRVKNLYERGPLDYIMFFNQVPLHLWTIICSNDIDFIVQSLVTSTEDGKFTCFILTENLTLPDFFSNMSFPLENYEFSELPLKWSDLSENTKHRLKQNFINAQGHFIKLGELCDHDLIESISGSLLKDLLADVVPEVLKVPSLDMEKNNIIEKAYKIKLQNRLLEDDEWRSAVNLKNINVLKGIPFVGKSTVLRKALASNQHGIYFWIDCNNLVSIINSQRFFRGGWVRYNETNKEKLAEGLSFLALGDAYNKFSKVFLLHLLMKGEGKISIDIIFDNLDQVLLHNISYFEEINRLIIMFADLAVHANVWVATRKHCIAQLEGSITIDSQEVCVLNFEEASHFCESYLKSSENTTADNACRVMITLNPLLKILTPTPLLCKEISNMLLKNFISLKAVNFLNSSSKFVNIYACP